MRCLLGIQARTASTRLRKKIYEFIGTKSVIEHVYQACHDAMVTLMANQRIYVIPCVAILGPENDQLLKEYCEDREWGFIGGSTGDLYDRYQAGLDAREADALVRVTADCWNLDPRRIIDAITAIKSFDYASNTVIRSYPEGQDVQACRKKAFEWINKSSPKEREHPFMEFDDNAVMREKFERAGYKWTNLADYSNPIFEHNSIDTLEDLGKARAKYEIRFKTMDREKQEGSSTGPDGNKQQKMVGIR